MILLVLSYLAGVLTIASPCILPVLPSCSLAPTGRSCAAVSRFSLG